ncbi:hypothetical protein OGAPHI_002614 [Ogataea philodendri]|uniref:Uncharacterized protein n=1 Tax=Ogataea philodendri TaxID=1378263 RepID=A0A9P8PCB2_9ASCO|nr:uncharacterized protein OGAPHI_002614 [Ogataea philodendri]KAH3668859.1 hypothetical protein OGAPHI_002614 [Ogataea philodendri]
MFLENREKQSVLKLVLELNTVLMAGSCALVSWYMKFLSSDTDPSVFPEKLCHLTSLTIPVWCLNTCVGVSSAPVCEQSQIATVWSSEPVTNCSATTGFQLNPYPLSVWCTSFVLLCSFIWESKQYTNTSPFPLMVEMTLLFWGIARTLLISIS